MDALQPISGVLVGDRFDQRAQGGGIGQAKHPAHAFRVNFCPAERDRLVEQANGIAHATLSRARNHLGGGWLQSHPLAIGDVVKIVECRPLSKQKRWMVLEIVQKAGE